MSSPPVTMNALTWLENETSNMANESDLEVSVVIPCLNEKLTLPTCIRKAQAAFAAHGLTAEVVVADNGSTDGGDELARSLGARVIHVAERGYGAALKAGIASARGRFVVMGDADDSYDFGSIFPFIERLRNGADLVMGCRFPSGGGKILPGAMPWHHRWFGNPVLSAIGRLFYRTPVTDFHCGMRAFRKDALAQLDLRASGMEFASEMIVRASVHRLRIEEVPITLHKDGRDRPPHLRSFRDGWRHLRLLLIYSPRWLFILPGTLLSLTGLIFGSLLLAGPLSIGPVVFDASTLFVCAMLLLLGFQVLVYGVFARVLAEAIGILPRDESLHRIARKMRLETGLVLGAVCAGLGFARLLWAVWVWERQGFGALSYAANLRMVIPGGTGIVLGIQLIFSSFFLSMLGLDKE